MGGIRQGQNQRFAGHKMKFETRYAICIFAVLRDIIFEYIHKVSAKLLQITVTNCVHAQKFLPQASKVQYLHQPESKVVRRFGR